MTIPACRFQRKQYAAIEIVQTEKKGFGLRATVDLPKCVTAVPWTFLPGV